MIGAVFNFIGTCRLRAPDVLAREAFAQAGREERKLLDARTASVVRALSHTTPPLFREAQSWTRRVGRNRLA
ncbi:hypothetical protein NLM33_14095 [Bradyrhizobium sp. CCGUVB1N3]|uniref:hypothetical protein n=1 Tax=Bradyrhizobium sp. CCGUVB1N3 TaxID=2949629 RepID=UPI0020B225CF|nr:hypothetical protein [Bradyrhizobium sp. CCGUVB1N3]MCP3471462.1 hypothetical protein [Bradyrhizobium sp. CCGUVB1N3]